MKRLLILVLASLVLFPGFVTAQQADPFVQLTEAMRAMVNTFKQQGVNKESCTAMAAKVTEIKQYCEMAALVTKDNAQQECLIALDRDLELLKFQLVNFVSESTTVTISLGIVVNDYKKLRDLRVPK